MHKRLGIFLVWVLLTGQGALSGGPALAQTWTITTLDSVGDVGHSTDLQVGPSGDLNVLYYRNDNQTLEFGAPHSPSIPVPTEGSISTLLIAMGRAMSSASMRRTMGL